MTFRENQTFKAGVRDKLERDRFLKERREDELARLSAPTMIRTLLHHCVLHPLAGLCFAVGFERAGEWLHQLVLDPGT